MGGGTDFLRTFAIGSPVALGVMQANAAKNAAEATARAAQFNADLALAEGARKAGLRREAGRRTLSQERANLSARGITASGSPLDVIALRAADIERDAQSFTTAARNAALLDRAQAKFAKREARTRGRASILLGATQAAATGAKFFERPR